MRKHLAFIGIFCLLGYNLFSQKQIHINFNNVVDTVKADLLGGNKLFANTMTLLHDEGIKQIRTHDIHHILDYSDYSDFWNYDGNGYTINQNFDPCNPSHYHWAPADSVTGLIINNNFNVFFRIGVSYPTQGILAPPYEAPCNSTSEPLIFSRFASMTKQTYKHYCEGWDNGFQYDIEYWELWNEPGGIFFNGTVQQFYSMYKAVCDSLKSYAPDIKIGALSAVPTTSLGISNPGYREGFMNFCANNGLPLDFYSWHIYGMKNPYVIKAYADTIRALLDERGFTETESIISETNSTLDSSLDTLTVSPYGAAYYLSIILSAQIAPLDKLLWYPSSVSGQNTRSHHSRACFNRVIENTPLIVENDGNIVHNGSWNTYEDNFMVLAAKSADYSKLYILISNLQSDVTSIELNVDSLPWTSSDRLTVKRSVINDQYIYHTTFDTLQGAQTLTLSNPDCPNPGVLFYEIEKLTVSINAEFAKEDVKIFPNPARQTVTVQNAKGYNIRLTDISGKTVFSTPANKHNKTVIDVSCFAKGVYFLTLYNKLENNLLTKKIIIY